MLPPRTLFTFALEREAKPFRRRCPDAAAIVIGAGPSQSSASIAKSIAANRPEAIVIAGFVGALRDDLKVGHVVVAREVVDQNSGGVCISPLSRLCGRGDRNGNPIRLLTANRVIGNPDEKRAMAQRFQADTVDMESAAVARICEANDIPWAAVRVISDQVDTPLSPELIDLLSGGSVLIRQIFAAVLRKPSLLAEFRRLARDTRFAAERLADYLQLVRAGNH
jgi:adenosylhomocysteine nucleosidase